MTKRQKLTIEASEKRQRLNELLALDELTDEQRAELETLSKRMQHIEVELRAAITAEAADEAEARGLFGNNGDGEAAETRRLLETVTINDYLGPATAGLRDRGPGCRAECGARCLHCRTGRRRGPAVGRPGGSRLHGDGRERWIASAAAHPTKGCSALASWMRWACAWTPFRPDVPNGR